MVTRISRYPCAGALLAVSIVLGACASADPPRQSAGGLVDDPFTDVAASPAQSGGDRPEADIDAIVNREARTISGDINWYDADHLVVSIKDPGAEAGAARLISLDGEVGASLAKGDIVNLSPDGEASIAYEAGGWVLEDSATGKTYAIDPPEDDARAFEPHYRAPVWSADSRYVAFFENHRPMGARDADEPLEIDGVKLIDMDAKGPPLLTQWASRLAIIDRRDPKSARWIAMNDLAMTMAWDEENSLFIVEASFFKGDPATRVHGISLDAAEMEEIYSTPGRFQNMVPAVQPGGDLMALVFNVDTRIWDEFQSIMLIDVVTGEEVRRLTHDLPILNAIWAPDGKELYAQVRGGGLDQLYAIPLEGAPRQLTSGPRRHFGMALSEDGQKLAYRTLDGYGRDDIRVLDLTSGEETVVLTLDEPAREFNLGVWRHVRWQSTDGVNPFGYVFLPSDFDPDRQYPMIVDVHGGGPGSRLYLFGPLTAGVARSPLEWHAWAALGYVVFVPDYRSTGDYGAAPIIDIAESGRLAAHKDIEDVMSGVQFMLDQGFIDQGRVALLGHSAGGRRAYKILNTYDLFAAAILNESITPGPASMFIVDTSGARTGGYPKEVLRQAFGGALSDVPERYKDNIMFDSYRNKTPTLIMVGNEDLGGVAHLPSEVMYSILKENGVPTRMLKFLEEGHNYTRPESARFAFEEVRKWLETHMSKADEADMAIAEHVAAASPANED